MISRFKIAAFAGISLLAIAAPAIAQNAPADEAADDASEIVVTGTLTRGVAPAGTNVVSVSKEAVLATGASTTAQLMQSIPQMGSFNDLQRQVGGGNFVTSNRPNLRDFPGFTTKGSAATLMLVDGHRVVGMGISVTNPDVDIVPPGIIERVEIVPDGGSAIYGSEAVAGVINFITKKDFKGLNVDARYGFGETNYHTFDANVTAGHSWDAGNAFISYNYAENSTFYGRDRDFVKFFPANGAYGQPTTQVECPGGTVLNRINGLAYALPYAKGAGVSGTVNQCDLSDQASVYPENKRHTVFAGFTQDLSDSIKFDVRGFYMTRKTYQSLGIFHGNANIGPSFIAGLTVSPLQSNYFATAGSAGPFGPFEVHQVNFGFGADNAANQNIKLDAWSITPTITADLGNSWQARALLDYGESKTEQHSTRLNTTYQNNAITAGLFNPYNPSLSDPAALAAITNSETFGLTRQKQFNARVIVDGDLATLPGGGLKLAVGAEYLHATMRTQRGDTVPGTQDSGFAGLSIGGKVIIPVTPAIPVYTVGRNVTSLYGELVAPLFSKDNRTTGFEELTLSISGRYDHYSDTGNTFNPKLGLTWKPTEWLKLRGSWGKSFAAPSLADNPLTDPTALTYFNGGTFGFLVPSATLVANGYPAPTATSTGIILLGSKPGTKPEKATTFSLGADLTPVDGMKLSVTYWNIKYRDLIVQAPFTSTSLFFSTFGGTSFTVNPTQAQVDAAVASAVTTTGSICAPTPSCVYIIEDVRKTNLGRFFTRGLDFDVNYRTETGFGSIDFAVNASYILGRENSATATSPLVSDVAANRSRFFVRSSLGANIGGLRAQAVWNHRKGYALTPAVPAAGAFPIQDRIGSYNVFDLYFKYDFSNEGMMKDLTLSLGINNVFSKDPPEWHAQQITLNANGFANGNTVGRVVQVGLAKKF
jgi:iron complex outermembrane recepter protein